MVLSLVQDTGIHHLQIETDKQGLHPQVCCWCSKRMTLDFTWGVKRFSRSLNSFLVEHESCLPIGEQQAQPVPQYQRGNRVSCETQGVTFTGRIAQLTIAGGTVVYHIEAETPNGRTTPVFVEECEITGLAARSEEEEESAP